MHDNEKSSGASKIDLSVVIPVFNEESIIEGTMREVVEVLTGFSRRWELVVVDDGSSDDTCAILERLEREIDGLHLLRLRKNSGQSAALITGMKAAAGRVIVTMDADGQNDPADIPKLLDALADCDCCCGFRRVRKDSLAKRVASKMANAVRNRVLGEDIVDTGCTLKAFSRHLVPDLRAWDGVHRFLPSLFMMQGARVKQIAVNHRPRAGGESKYTNLGRLKRTVADLRGVKWMKSRYVRVDVEDPQ